MTKAKEYSLLDEFEIRGFWYLPNQSSKKMIPGTLSFSKEKIYLDLLGTLNDNEYDFHDTLNPKIEIILGTSESGEKFTLFHSLNIKKTTYFPGYAIEKYSVASMIVGNHFETENQLQFHSLKFHCLYIEEWIDKRPIQKESTHTIEGLQEIKGSFKHPESTQAYIPQIESLITTDSQLFTQYNPLKQMTWRYNGFIKITPDHFQTLEWFRNKLSDLRDLFTLFVGQATYFTKIQLYGEENELIDGKPYRESYDLFLKQPVAKIDEKFKSTDGLFTLSDVENTFEIVLQNWFSKLEALEPVCELYFGTFYIDMYQSTYFLNTIQALESYHRKLYKGTYFDQTEYNDSLEKINIYLEENFSPEIQERLSDLLKYGNEFSLNKRLKEVGNKLSKETISFLFGSSKEMKRFIKKVVDTRNYLTHFNEEKKDKVFKGIDLYYANQRLKTWLSILLFKELGINDEKILSQLKENDKISFMIPKIKQKINS